MRRRAFIGFSAACAFSMCAPALEAGRKQRVVFVAGIDMRHATDEARGRQHDGNLRLFAAEGWVPGPAFELEYVAIGSASRADLEALARRVVATEPALIIMGGDSAVEFKQATTRIPLVFYGGIDPAREGLVASPARPGGNMTGASAAVPADAPKGWELLRELAPRAKRIGYVWHDGDLDDPEARAERAALEVAAQRLQLELVDVTIPMDAPPSTFDRVVRQARIDLLDASILYDEARPDFVGVPGRARIPALWAHGAQVRKGGLVSSNPSLGEAYREAFRIAALILRGANPAVTPVRMSRRYDTVINLRTARAMGLTFPQSVLLRADVAVE